MMQKQINVYRGLMGANEVWAQKTRAELKHKNIRLLNIIGSPGAGKTALLEKTHAYLAPDIRFAVLEGDVETTRDSERLAHLNIPVSQLLTEGACHLEAKLVHHALLDLPLHELDMVMVENVGNLVCPAEFDIGEMAKIAVLSVTEGEDKALKYPLLFREAKAVVVSKIDLLPHIPFNLDTCLEAIKQINSQIPILTLSSLRGEGMQEWVSWLKSIRLQPIPEI